ncbi:MAG: hypothetical protein J6Q22_22250 [Prevotella sp.]|nr:hypothetical protein [Prevotella sp.]
MSNEKEQKPTVLEANLAFDASPAMFESIMAEGPIKYGLDDDGIDMITTPEGDEVVDPRSIMDVNVEAPVQSGARFNQDVDPISQEEGDRYMEQFQDYIENVHKLEINDDDIDVAGATIQMLNNTQQDIAGYIRQQIADATARLSQQNVNPAQPDGVAADMTGEDRIPADGQGGELGGEMGADMGAEGAPDLGDEGLTELDTTTHLTPEEDAGDAGLGDIDMGLGDMENMGGEPAPEAGAGEDIDLGLDSEPAAPAEGGEAPAGEEAPAEPEATSEEPSEEGDEYDPFSDLDIGEVGEEDTAPAGEEAPAGDEGGAPEIEPVGSDEGGDTGEVEPSDAGEEDEEKKSEPLTESVHQQKYRLRLESVMNSYDRLCKRREAQAKCEAIVNAANQKMIAESVNQKNIKAQCESIVGAYRQATGKNKLRAKLESIVGKYRQQKMLAESVVDKNEILKQKCNAILENANRFGRMKAQCESIVNDFRKAEYTANTAKAIIDSYKQSLA